MVRDVVQDFLHEIYFLPDHPELQEIQMVLQDYRKVSISLCFNKRVLEHENGLLGASDIVSFARLSSDHLFGPPKLPKELRQSHPWQVV